MDRSLCQVVGVDLDDDSYFLNLVKMDMITGARLSWWVIGLAKYPPALTGSSISLASEQALALRRWKSLKILKPLHLCRVSQKNALSECCWSHNALAQSSFAGTPFGTPCIQQGADWRGAFKTCYTWEPATSSSGWQERASLKTARAFGVGSDSGQLLFVKNNSSKDIF